MSKGASASSNYIIETSHGAAGVVVKSRRGFRFFSAAKEFDCLDGKAFASPAQAAAAAIRQAEKFRERRILSI